MKILRSGLHAVIVFALLNVVAAGADRAGSPGPKLLLDQVRTGSFALVSLATAGSLHKQRVLLAILVVGTLTIAWPWSLNDLPQYLVPIAAGILLGTGLQRVIREASIHKAPEGAWNNQDQPS